MNDTKIDLFAITDCSDRVDTLDVRLEADQGFVVDGIRAIYSQDQTTLSLDAREIFGPFIAGPGSSLLKTLRHGQSCFDAGHQELTFSITAFYKDAGGNRLGDCFLATVKRNGGPIYADAIERRTCKSLGSETEKWALPRIGLWSGIAIDPAVLNPLWARADKQGAYSGPLSICFKNCN